MATPRSQSTDARPALRGFRSACIFATHFAGIMLCAIVTAVAAAGAALADSPTPSSIVADPLSRLSPAPEGIDARGLAEQAMNALRSDTTHMRAKMTVSSPRLSSDRVVIFESWDDLPGKRNLIRIHSPSKDRGSGFLKLAPNLWMYVPRVERTVRIPPSMMLQSWMGSDFTNDDLVNESSELDDYEHRLLGVDPDAGENGAYVLEYKPLEEAPVVWGKIIGWLDMKSGTPLRQDFYDEDGERVRTMTFEDIRVQGSRHVPHRWQLTPLDKEGHRTIIEIEQLDFDVELDDSIFTTRNLKKTH